MELPSSVPNLHRAKSKEGILSCNLALDLNAVREVAIEVRLPVQNFVRVLKARVWTELLRTRRLALGRGDRDRENVHGRVLKHAPAYEEGGSLGECERGA